MMKEKSTTFGLNPRKIVELFKISKDSEPASVDVVQDKSDLIGEKLNETVPIYFTGEKRPVRRLRRLQHTIAVLSGEPIGKLLQNPKTDIVLIKMIKDYGRKLSSQMESEAEHHVYNTIYYAAIAHAIVYHDTKITNYSYEKLRDSFCYLSRQNWIPNNLIDLFKKVAKICEAK
jgi:hypothetical protein